MRASHSIDAHPRESTVNVMEPLDQEIANALKERSPKRGPARMLFIASEAICGEDLIDALRAKRHRCSRAGSLDEARRAIARRGFEVVIIDRDLAGETLREFIQTIRAASNTARVVIVSRETSVNAAIDAIRCGACDYITAPVQVGEFIDRIEAAIRGGRIDREREERVERLMSICEQLNIARAEVSDQLDRLCHDMVCAYREMSDQINEVAMSSEFRTLLRQELDIEDLLRTALQYLLTRTGPTNAAVFLPDGEGDYTLGAYVNYDCPRDTIGTVLDRLGEAICPQLADETEIMSFADAADFAEWIGVDSAMLKESQVLAFSCRNDGRCMAVVVLFRTESRPFTDELANIIDVLRPIFAEQLANVVRVHRRAEPSWPKDAVDEDYDFNDDHGFGFGGLAA
jgi:DNA-binding response OmpR family regulator